MAVRQQSLPTLVRKWRQFRTGATARVGESVWGRNTRGSGPMAQRAEALADRFAQASNAFIAFVETIPEALWGKEVSEGDPRSVGVVVEHIIWWQAIFLAHCQALATGDVPRPLPEFDATNAELALLSPVSRDEALVELRTDGKSVVDWARGLSDDQLRRSGGMRLRAPRRTVAWAIGRLFVGHLATHLEAQAENRPF